ncbi:MAG: endonuclease/exonuclease/phosphatase family protein [Saprospiraceae bacterium]|nr:endonuclease/exonuclease/phosphatase family protein [Saprospiraceae bacterium]MBK9727074.1 endonuclease/exonuclease/phosphatase family protein [Saprospiraceae bacterium]
MLRFLLSVNIVWTIICLVIYAIVGLDPARFWMFSISSLFIPILFLINILFVLFWLVFHWRYVWLPILTLLAGWSSWNLLFSFGEEFKSKKCQQESFTIMSYNVYGLKQLKDTSQSKMLIKKSKFTAFIREHEPDIICAQENNFFSDDIINKTGLYPYFHYMIQHGAAIYSRFPILDKGLVEFGTKTNSCLWVDILVQGKKIRVYSVHLQSNRITKEVETITDEQEEKNQEKINVIRKMLRKYRNTAIVRSKQAKLLSDHASLSPIPCIIAGDFNDTPFSHSYKILSKGRNDSFIKCGSGLGTTYIGALPGLRIDYVLGDENILNFCSHRVLHTSYSDHNPILVKCYAKW